MTGTTLTTSASFFKTTMSIWSSAGCTSCALQTYRLQGVTGGVDEEDTAVDPGVRDEAVSHGGELLAKVSGMLVFDLVISVR
jgi:hypothetical protein